MKNLDNSSWAKEELEKVDFGDKRLNKRFLKVATSQAKTPQLSINAASFDWSCAKGAYRFFDNPKVLPEKILEPHIENTELRPLNWRGPYNCKTGLFSIAMVNNFFSNSSGV